MVEISTVKAPGAIGPYSQGVKAGEMVFISGQLPINVATKEMPEGMAERAKQVFLNLSYILEEAGLTLADVVKTTVFMTDLSEFVEMNGVYETFFSKPFPARSTVEVSKLPLGSNIEIECIAVKK